MSAKTFLAAIIIGLMSAAFPAAAGLFNPQSFELENGMQVVVISDHRAPVVTHMVWYKVGAADEQSGKSGIAHFLEHLMFRGTAKFADGEFSKIISRNGGADNAFTSFDYTGYFQNVAVDKLDLVMAMESDRMRNLKLSDGVVDPERQVIISERRQRTDANPSSLLSEQMAAAQYLAHPYRIPIIGWQHEIQQLTAADAIAFYDRYYAPNNAILIIAGDVTIDDVRPLAEKHYGPIARREVPARARIKEPPQIAPRRVVLSDVRVSQPAWQRSYLAPSAHGGATEHALPLDLLADILGGGATGRLYRSLVIEQGIAASAGAYYSGLDYDLTRFWLSAQPKPGGDVAAIEAAVDAVIAEVLKDGVTEEELTRSKSSMRASATYARDSLGTGARIFGMGLTSGLTIDQIESWPERIGKVTVEQVNRAARYVLDMRRSVTGILKPKPQS